MGHSMVASSPAQQCVSMKRSKNDEVYIEKTLA
jgi:hypothetical protein